MTASSVEFFPCRVQLMGLPRSTSTAAPTTTGGAPPANLQTPSRRPPPKEKLHGVSRNLFGSPEPGEINNMFQQETKRQHTYVFQRYNIDINALRGKVLSTKGGTDSVAAAVAAAPRQPTQLPTLIAHELKQHEQRLQKEECNLNRAETVSSTSSEITPPNAKIHQLKSCGVAVNKIMRRCCPDDGLTPTSTASVERQKPYTRQPKLTERFNLRKNKICSPSFASSLSESAPASSASASSSSSSSQTVAFAETFSLHNSPLEDTHRDVKTLQLPQAMRAEWMKKDYISEPTTTTRNDNIEIDSAEETNNDDSSSQKPMQRVSLKIVLTAQNAVSTTTSSTSTEHDHHA